MMNVIAGYDNRDSTSVAESKAPLPDYLAGLDEVVSGLRIAIIPELVDKASLDVGRAVRDALNEYKKMGAAFVEVNMPHFDYAIAAYYVIATAEASSNLARYDGCHYGYRSPAANDYIEVYSKSRAEGFGAEVKRRIMLGTFALSSGYYDAYYLKALKVRNLIRLDFIEAFGKADCMMMPVAPTTAFKLGEKTADPLQMYLADVYTIAANLAGVPGISIPCGFDGDKLPIGLQIISPAFSEDKLLRIARMFESKTGYHRQRPSL
jgi:aspartyl-tRNA(Asn)/glutamyl-tRNA(Gln) amidotransferase subunit A